MIQLFQAVYWQPPTSQAAIQEDIFRDTGACQGDHAGHPILAIRILELADQDTQAALTVTDILTNQVCYSVTQACI